ncbi:structural maintenance of chromosomes (SMC) family protein [Actinidia rufa]|uniref:Structural maintenance of chromosomes (SMC) family protein n=1 Tax=Actinidia rufa TaxID=165716 RepID=A0A7J0DVH2_9ERIC|nr:structural maintenance of chromosomes (SMC) family protein [Actinidia rufa]
MENEVRRMEMEQKIAPLRLEKRVNKKVIAMFEKAEDEYNNLISKKNIIEIMKLINNNLLFSDFGSIFSTLLPGTMAKLEPLEGCSFSDGIEEPSGVDAALDLSHTKNIGRRIKSFFTFTVTFSVCSTLFPGTMAKLEPLAGSSFLDGVEVRVAFGGVWKQSLLEPSGGQRSLLALSLILAILLFTPAPLYILDEARHLFRSLKYSYWGFDIHNLNLHRLSHLRC